MFSQLKSVKAVKNFNPGSPAKVKLLLETTKNLAYTESEESGAVVSVAGSSTTPCTGTHPATAGLQLSC